MKTFQGRMKAAREAKGLSYERAAAHASRLLMASQEFGEATCRRIEQGDEEDADPIRLWALAQVYDVPLEVLSPLAAGWFATLCNGATRITWNSAGQLELALSAA